MSFLSRSKTAQRTSRPNLGRKSLFRSTRFLPAAELLEDRKVPAVLTVNFLVTGDEVMSAFTLARQRRNQKGSRRAHRTLLDSRLLM
jgi:hypothetical protein